MRCSIPLGQLDDTSHWQHPILIIMTFKESGSGFDLKVKLTYITKIVPGAEKTAEIILALFGMSNFFGFN